MTEQVLDLDVAGLRPHPANARRTLGDISEMIASIKEAGILEPLVARRIDDAAGHELVFGHRRLAAAKAAGMTTVPVIVRQYDDQQALEAQLIENVDRANLEPLDEAEAYRVMLSRGYTEQQLADKIGQPLRYVLERLALCNLCKAGREALEQERILLGVAILVAQLPAKVQTAALEEVTNHFGDLTTVKHARESIERRVLLQLKDAPFKLDDAELVPAAGPCTTCKKRTGNQTELFAEASSADLCIDPPCHRSKVDALYQLRLKAARTEGIEVLSKKDSAEVLKSCSLSYGESKLVRLDQEVFLGSGKRKKLRALFGKELPPVTLARDEETGMPVELVPRSAAAVVVKAADPQASVGTDPVKQSAKAKAERDAERLQAEVRRRVMLELVESMEGDVPGRDAAGRLVWRVLVGAAIHSLPPDVAKTVANRRGCPVAIEEGATTPKRGKGKRQATLTPEQRLQAFADKLSAIGLGGLLLELLLVRAAPGKWSEAHASYTDACLTFGVDVAEHEKTVKAEAKDKAKNGGKAAPKPAKAKATEKAPARPQHPATGQVVHYVDPTGLSKSGVSCGGKVGGGKGTMTDEAAKVTCKSCLRTAGLDDAGEP